jgi:CTP:molybdopterin cytidylyltransferase MocA
MGKTRKPRYTGRVSGIRYNLRTTVPVRDFGQEGAPVAFLVDIYGVRASAVSTVGGDVGARPLVKAVRRLGLDPERYRATLWDVPTR